MRAVDVMGFAGGFTLGTVQAGFELVGKRELKGGFGVPNCEANRHLLGDAWKTQVGDDADWEPVEAEYVFGNPPCSGFSLLSSREFRGIDSPINACMHAFAGYVGRVAPLIAAFESVGQAFSQGLELMRALHAKVVANTGLDYDLYHVKHNNLAVGGCAIRKRYFWLVSRVPFGVEHPIVREKPTFGDAILDLQDLPHTWELQPRTRAASAWAEPLARDLVDGHVWVSNSDYRRGMDLLAVAGPWKHGERMSVIARRYHESGAEFPDTWPNAPKYIARDFENMGYHQLCRWYPDQPARVITGGGLGSILHPTHDRLLTHREVARVMGFPDDWRIHPLRNQSNLRATWGKGIPVGSGRWLSTWVRRSLLGHPGSLTGESMGDGEWLINCSDVKTI